MAKRHYVVRANFPKQGLDLCENIVAGGWPAALGQAARVMKRKMKGLKVKVASFTLEQQEQKVTVAPNSQVAEQMPIPTSPDTPPQGSESSQESLIETTLGPRIPDRQE